MDQFYGNLIDNATISGVERLIGASEVKNLNNIDHDIACFEKLISAILFSDKLYYIDDYKSYYKNRRAKNFPFMSALPVSEAIYEHASLESAKYARSKIFQMKDGIPIGEVIDFFDQLQLNPQLRWNVFTSSEYLTLSYLIDDEIAPPELPTAAIGMEEAEQYKMEKPSSADFKIYSEASGIFEGHPISRTPEEYIKNIASKNKYYRGIYGGHDLQRIVFGFGWAAERSAFYESISNLNNLNLTLSPLRDAYCLSAIGAPKRAYIDSMISTAAELSIENLKKISKNSDYTALSLKVPFFSSWLLSKTKTPSAAIEKAFEIRESDLFSDARQLIRELNIETVTNKKKKINKIIKMIEVNNNALLKKICGRNKKRPKYIFKYIILRN